MLRAEAQPLLTQMNGLVGVLVMEQPAIVSALMMMTNTLVGVVLLQTKRSLDILFLPARAIPPGLPLSL